jgi:cysteine desulfurase / selenocysteine lyase
MRNRFPFFELNPDIIYLDSAATSQTLDTVIQDTNDFLLNHKANAHRSGHSMGAWVDEQYHSAKAKIGEWLGINDADKRIVFNSGATQGLYDAIQLATRDQDDFSVFVGGDFHHSLALPFHSTGYNHCHYIKITDSGVLDLSHLEELLRNDASKVKIIAITAVGNVTGTINDLEKIRSISKQFNAITIIDACQSMGKIHHNYDDFDFVAWSWHKVYGPQGLGCLMIDPRWLDSSPVRPGGGSITSVSYETQTYVDNAQKFESGTPNLQAIVTLPRLLDWLIIHQEQIISHDQELTKLANSLCKNNPYTSETGLITMIPEVGTVEDIALLLDVNKIMLRGGNLCAEPLVRNVSANSGLLRISWGAYTTAEEIEIAFKKIGETYERISRFI